MAARRMNSSVSRGVAMMPDVRMDRLTACLSGEPEPPCWAEAAAGRGLGRATPALLAAGRSRAARSAASMYCSSAGNCSAASGDSGVCRGLGSAAFTVRFAARCARWAWFDTVGRACA